MSKLHYANIRIDKAKINQSKKLDLSNLGLYEIPRGVFELSHLEELNIGDNNLTKLPNILSRLVNLKTLTLWCNDLTDIPTSIKYLSNLQELYLYGNSISTLPKELGGLKKLKKLGLRDNRLQEIPKSINKLTNIEEIDLRDNLLVEIPMEITELRKLNNLLLEGNPIQVPSIEIVNQGLKAIKNYFKSLNDSGSVKLNEAKLLIVGEGGVGKSALLKALTLDNYDLNEDNLASTEGIEIKSLKFTDKKEFCLNIWDFGGQEIYHSTHQFFLTRRSLYILVWEARKDYHLTFDYWLNIVNLLSSKSPIIIVLNKIDERITQIDEESLIKRYPNILSFEKVSVRTKQGIRDLKFQIKDALKDLPSVGDVLPAKWIDIKDYLNNLNQNYIEYSEYINICKSFGLNKEKASFLSRYYHDLGTYLHFCDNVVLRDTIFLKPDWATNAVYNLLDRKEIILKNGRFSFDFLEFVWKEYPKEKHYSLIELLKRFELCFQIANTNNYIIPELLPVKIPKIDIDFEKCFTIEYRYAFMPSGIVTRFIARKHDLVYKDYYWRSGLVIKFYTSYALIVSDTYSRKIIIKIVGKETPELLALVRHELTSINKSLNNPDVKEMIPCKCSGCVKDSEPHYFSYQSLLFAKETQTNQIQCQKYFFNIPLDNLLNEDIFKEIRPITPNSNMKDFDKIEAQGENIQIIKGENIQIGKVKNRFFSSPKKRKLFWTILLSLLTAIAAIATILGTNLLDIFGKS